jgi:hypothetical protein
MPTALADLPRYLVLSPTATVRIELELDSPACEIDVELDNPRPGRSFVLLLGHRGGPFVQRVRLAGKARIFFDPEAPGSYELLLANPHSEPLVLHLRGRPVASSRSAESERIRPTVRRRGSPPAAPVARRHRGASRRRTRSEHRPGSG